MLRLTLSVGRTLVAALLLTFASFVVVAPQAVSEGNADYCAAHPEDPRCKPDYCREYPNDLWCQSPQEYCYHYPDDPICKKETGEPKRICAWQINGAPAVPFTRGAAPGPQTVTLDCPNHMLASWACTVKGREPGEVPLPNGDPVCAHAGTVADPTAPCRTVDAWNVVIPNLDTATMSLKASMWKDEDCDGKADDWNSGYVDATGVVVCKLPNAYGPKDGFPSYPYTPAPDGVVDDCDLQHYELQWRQKN